MLELTRTNLGINLHDTPCEEPAELEAIAEFVPGADEEPFIWTLTGVCIFDPPPAADSSRVVVKEQCQPSSAFESDIITVEKLCLTREIRFTVVKLDIIFPGLEEEEEEDPGAFVRLNDNDSDESGVPDMDESPLLRSDPDLTPFTIMLYPPDLPTNFIVDLAGIDNCYEDSRKITNALAIYSADRFPLRLYLEGRAAGKHEIDAVERESLACDKVVYSVFLVDLDVDSDNDDGFGMPDQSVEEDRIEDDSDKPGKLIGVNDADQDGDGVPNFADGFDLWGNEGANAGGQFAPLVLTLEGPMDEGAAEVTFNYSCSDPAYVTRS